MTQLLVRVLDATEAAQAGAAGVDAIELDFGGNFPSDIAMAHAVRGAFHGCLRLRVNGPTLPSDILLAAGAIHADEVALDVHAMVQADLPQNLRWVAILSNSQMLDAIKAVRDRVGSVMLDAGDSSRLIDKAGIATLDAFASACRAHDVPFGLAGGLEMPDVSRLLLLQPDVLSFETAVRVNHVADGALDPQALHAIRALVPRTGPRTHVPAAIAKVIDRIFVRDFEVSLSIGAYRAEHGKSQRVRFSIVTDVVRAPGVPHDMRDVFSYDVIIETIRVLSERAHVTFVETLAEEIAASLLTHADVVAVHVKVEKLDVIRGSVGIEILRQRDAK